MIKHSLEKTFVVMSPEKSATPVDVSPALYQDIDRDFNGFKQHELISCHEFSADWEMWEMHPAGDEIVMLISGATTLVLEENGIERSVLLSESCNYVVIPKGVWHTARTDQPTKLVFVTPGEGTQHR